MTRVVPARRATVAGEPVARVEDRRDRRRRAALPIPALLPVLAVLLVLLAAAMVGRGLGTRPGISPSPSSGASAVAGVPASRPAAPPSVEASPSASPTASPSESPSPIPKATPKPTQKPTPVATPRPTPRPTTRPTPAPTPTPKPASTAPSRDPAETVRRFYSLVVQHRFSEAAQLWSARMRQQYPPKQYIDRRFAATTGIDVRRDAITSESVARRPATVAVDLLEHRRGGSTRHWVGSWDLVLTSAGWLMNQPHF